MKIGILTFHFGINFGGVLQCYALKSFLEKQGNDVEIINFVPPGFKYTVWWKGNEYRQSLPFGLFKAYAKLRYSNKQRAVFGDFVKKYLNLSMPCTIENFPEVCRNYSAVIVGSDQVWTPSQHYHAAYFLKPLDNFDGRKISYAPCCARNHVDSPNVDVLKKCLSDFDSISARNLETQQFVRDLTGNDAELVVDPTLLPDFKLDTDSVKITDSRYILVYVLGKEIEGGHRAVIKNIKKTHGDMPVYAIILSENKPKLFSWADRKYMSAGPLEWVELIKKSGFVYTDSFHGLLFALKYKKPFLAYYAEPDRASRFLDFAARFDLSRHIVDSYAASVRNNAYDNAPDYKKIDSLLFEQIDRSVKFLNNALL